VNNFTHFFYPNYFLQTMYEQTRQTSDLRDELIDQLRNLNYTDYQLIESFIRFLPQSQLEELQDSIQRQEF
tara:strand:- start:508 stop:720 length:213 start_codon:yes stop_codon:yes gene_type:complete